MICARRAAFTLQIGARRRGFEHNPAGVGQLSRRPPGPTFWQVGKMPPMALAGANFLAGGENAPLWRFSSRKLREETFSRQRPHSAQRSGRRQSSPRPA